MQIKTRKKSNWN